jgi:competence protein ComEC
MATLALLAGALALGIARGAIVGTPGPNDISRFSGNGLVTIVGTVAGDPQYQPGRVTFILNAESWRRGFSSHSVDGATSVTVGDCDGEVAQVHDGDHVSVLGTCDVPLAETDPGVASPRQRFSQHDIWCQTRARRPWNVCLVARPGWQIDAAALAVRSRLLSVLRASSATDEFDVLSGILFGKSSEIKPQLRAEFSDTGTAHVLATAGLHVGIISIAFMSLFSLLSIHRRSAAMMMLIVVSSYWLMAGGRASVTRAVAMASLYFLGLALERVPDFTTTLSLVAAAIVWITPGQIWDPGFQMSFSTVIGIVTLLPVWSDFWKPRVSAIRTLWLRNMMRVVLQDFVGLCVASQLSSAAAFAAAYHELPLAGVPSNLLVVPIVALILISSLITLCSAVCGQAIAIGVAKVTVTPLARLLIAVVNWCSGWPLPRPAVSPEGVSWLVVIFVVLLAAGTIARHNHVVRLCGTVACGDG